MIIYCNLFTHWALRSSWELVDTCSCVPNRVGIWKCQFLSRWENWSTRGKTSRSKGENQQQTRCTYSINVRIRTWATLVGGESSHHCTIPFLPTLVIKWKSSPFSRPHRKRITGGWRHFWSENVPRQERGFLSLRKYMETSLENFKVLSLLSYRCGLGDPIHLRPKSSICHPMVAIGVNLFTTALTGQEGRGQHTLYTPL